MRRDDGRFDWDVPLGRRWTLLLLVAYLLPLLVVGLGHAVWIWPWSGWGEASFSDILLGLTPVLLAAFAWFILGIDRRRLRGALLFLACATLLLIPFGGVFETLEGLPGAWDAFLVFGWQGMALVLGGTFVAAGNRQQKRSLGRGIAPWLTGAGGLALLAVFCVPWMPALARSSSTSGTAPALLLLEKEVWATFWPLVVWFLALLAYGVLGALSPVAARVGDPFEAVVEKSISRLARLLAILFPGILLAAYAVSGLPGIGLFVLFLIKAVLHSYAVLILMTIGLARFLDDADPDMVWTPSPEEESAPPGEEPEQTADAA